MRLTLKACVLAVLALLAVAATTNQALADWTAASNWSASASNVQFTVNGSALVYNCPTATIIGTDGDIDGSSISLAGGNVEFDDDNPCTIVGIPSATVDFRVDPDGSWTFTADGNNIAITIPDVNVRVTIPGVGSCHIGLDAGNSIIGTWNPSTTSLSVNDDTIVVTLTGGGCVNGSTTTTLTFTFTFSGLTKS